LQIAASLRNIGPLKLLSDFKGCEWSTAKLVEALSISNDAFINLLFERQPKLSNARSLAGFSSLEMAVKQRNVNLVKRLIGEGPQSWDFSSPLCSPIHIAIYAGESVFSLPRVNALSEPVPRECVVDGFSACRQAIEVGYEALWRTLEEGLREDLESRRRDYDGWSLEDFSLQAGHPFSALKSAIEDVNLTSEETSRSPYTHLTSLIIPDAWKL
jgi:hypothetical protein